MLEGVATPHARQDPRRGSGIELAVAPNDLVSLHEENKLLREKLRSIKWPPLRSFQAYAHTYRLPVAAAAPVSVPGAEGPKASHLQYLAVFFDGDGCCFADQRNFELKIGQSFDQAEVLVLFKSAFGGGIYKLSDGRGLHKPVLQWRASGSGAVRAARLLAPHSLLKRKQLECAEDWSQLSRREPVVQSIKSLKQHDSGVDGLCSWAYMAGFFDAEGNIALQCNGALCLSLAQKFGSVLECLHRFLAGELGKFNSSGVRACTHGCFMLQVKATPTSKCMLQKMLQAGMVQKARQARLAIALTKENRLQTRNQLFDLVGNQKFAKRLDAVGAERARRIADASYRARYAVRTGQQDKASALLQEVETLKQAHAFHNARLENEQLRKYILKLQHMQQEHQFIGRELLYFENWPSMLWIMSDER